MVSSISDLMIMLSFLLSVNLTLTFLSTLNGNFLIFNEYCCKLSQILSILETLRIEKEVRLVLSVSSIIGVRAIESTLSKVEFFEVVRGEERIEIEKKEKSEDVYSFFRSLMEDL